MPTASAIGDGLCRFLRTHVLDERIEVTHDSSLNTLGVDSVSLVRLILHVENEFGVAIPDSALTPANLESVASLARYIQERLAP